MFAAVQAMGAIAGVLLAVVVSTLPPLTLVDHEISEQPFAALIIALLYILVLPGVHPSS